jgi:peptidoglycan/LPS O-acetylase OafA/YrhL
MRNSHLDFLRALSVLLVLLAHLGFHQIIPGGLGVTFFFGISGFIITKLLLIEFREFGNIQVKLFYRRRFWKIAPPLFFLVVIPSIYFWEDYSITIEKFAAQILFLFNWVQIYSAQGNFYPPSGVVWSLAIEEQFYIAIAVLIFIFQLIASNSRFFIKYITAVICTTWIVSTLSRIVIANQSNIASDYGETGNLQRIYIGTDTRISTICSGAILALITSNDASQNKLIKYCAKYPKITLAASAFLFLASLLIRNQFFRDTFRYTIQEAAIFLVIITGPVLNLWPCFLHKLSNISSVQKIGRSSYSLYLSHPIVLSIANNHFSVISTQVNHYLWSAICGTLCIVVGFASHRLFDVPFERRRVSARRIKNS